MASLLSFNPQSLTRLFPLVLGIAFAYALGGFLQLSAPAPKLSSGPTKVRAVSKKTSYDGLVRERNIMGLETPQAAQPVPDQVAEQEPVDEGPDPGTWRAAGAVVGRRTVLFVTVGDDTEFVYPGQSLHNWVLESVDPEGAVWVKGTERRRIAVQGDDTVLPGPKVAYTPPSEPEEKDDDQTGLTRKVTLNRSEISDVLKDPSAVLKDALFKPYHQDGQVAGYKVRNIKRDSILRKVGLRSGDVIMRINGTEVDTPKKLLDAYSGLDKANSVTLETLRRGQPLSVFVELK